LLLAYKASENKSIMHQNHPQILITAVFLLSLFLTACTAVELPQSPPQTTVAAIPRETTTPAATSTPAPTNTLAPTNTPAPTKTPTPAPSPTPQIYVVQAGDTLWSIAQAFETTIADIQRANELLDAAAIVAGQELVIPLSLSPEDTAAQETGDSPSERGVLPNHILCPAVDAIEDQEGTLIGRSAVCAIPIISQQFGDGETPLVIVGGIHGGYEWNTILLAYQIIDHLQENPDLIPPSLTIHIIPNANPDGLYAVTQKIRRFTAADVAADPVPGRVNGSGVDLNRNWDCDWTPDAWWGYEPVSGGSAPFSEPENQALRNFILNLQPAAALFLHSAATGVYAAGCDEIDPQSLELGRVYSRASGYRFHDQFEHYNVTGDAADWLTSQGIPSITVELNDHENLDWNMNLRGLQALLTHLSGS
jgi:LysM repeat protein/predicted deacylase